MGSGPARLIAAGHKVTVWNRTGRAAQPLVDLGATLAASPRDASQGAEFVIAMLRDDEVSRFVWLDPECGALAADKQHRKPGQRESCRYKRYWQRADQIDQQPPNQRAQPEDRKSVV